MAKVRAAVVIMGEVQGVSFRYFTRRVALQQRVCGWVRNLPGGEVEALFEGEETDVRTVLDWCRRGPDAARVDAVRVEMRIYTGEFANFEIRR
ncbi:MAG: acylphosphatase [Desulfuromonadales bacterium GWD2_61_12]|nr:MAG: acylphosphatase [Desulfuromonadales bacterium GWC2_61_20]OGR34565.1 MAG: acylphosphatase [Desulfuromonadales bacterium GWD2_61_12]HBT83794.1 acylphosphatase [Desulfuromonas sp.]